MKFLLPALLLVLCLPARTADSPAQVLFNRLRERVRADLARAPRYTCVETVTRRQYHPQLAGRTSGCAAMIASRKALASPGELLWHDRLRLDVAVGDKAEMFSWAGAKSFETNNLEDLALSGSSGSGEFGSFLASVFGNNAEGFTYKGEELSDLGTLAKYEYRVPLAKSHYAYKTRGAASATIPYGGFFYVVPSTAELKRLVVEATEFQTNGNQVGANQQSDVCRVTDTMDYTRIKVGAGDFMVPSVSTMDVLFRIGEESINETRFTNCHEFTGESTIRYDMDDEPTSAANVAKEELKKLPPKTHVRVVVDPPVNTKTAAAGAPITGVVEKDVKEKGKVLIRQTDRLHGRILRMEQFLGEGARWVVAIRFDSIERDGVEMPVTFKPVDDGDRTLYEPRPGVRRGPGPPAIRRAPVERPAGAGIFVFGQQGDLVLDRKFHSEWETR